MCIGQVFECFVDVWGTASGRESLVFKKQGRLLQLSASLEVLLFGFLIAVKSEESKPMQCLDSPAGVFVVVRFSVGICKISNITAQSHTSWN